MILRKLAVLFLILAVTAPLAASGVSGSVWGIEPEELMARLRRADYEFLRHMDFSSSRSGSVDAREARVLGDDAFHMLGLIYEGLGLSAQAERFFRLSWESASSPWARESAVALLELASQRGEYDEMLELAREASDDHPDDAILRDFFIEAAYSTGQDAEVLSMIVADEARPEAFGDTTERALWKAVSASRAMQAGWQDLYRTLFRDYRAHDAHSRVWVYVNANPGIRSAFSPGELIFFNAKRALAEGRAVESLELFNQVASSLDDPATGNLLLSPVGLRDFYIAGSLSGRQSATAGRLLELSEGSLPETRALALEYAGRLYRTAGNYSPAIDSFEQCLRLLPPGDDFRRVSWYLLTSRIRQDPSRAAAGLALEVQTLSDPGYFSDAFGELAARLADRESWDDLLIAYAALRDFATPGTLATYEIALAGALAQGFLPADAARRVELEQIYLERAAAQSENLFAALVAAARLGRSGEGALRESWVEPAGSGTDERAEPQSDGDGRTRQFLASYLRFGLAERAFELGFDRLEELQASDVDALHDALVSRGMIRSAVRLAIRVPANDDVIRWRYPLGHAAAFEEVVAQESVDRWVLYAMTREESAFDPEIVSHAGAIGLTQLMAETAEDIARRMRLDVYDLQDPLDNLRIGTRYLSMLTEQFEGVWKAIAAYNAGQGRMRAWERAHPGLDGILFHLAIPFPETRNHLRNVVVSAVHYGYLYGGRSPTETIRIIFGDSL